MRGLPDTRHMPSYDFPTLVRDRVIDAEGAALIWLLLQEGVPLIVAGAAPAIIRAELATALLGSVPDRAWVVLELDDEPPSTEQLSAIIVGGIGLGMTSGARDLKALLETMRTVAQIPEDAVRRLGLVAIVESTPGGTRIVALHYLRPSERDAKGHIQRRPPAVLATWDSELDSHEHFAWGVTPELADRIDRSQADLEDRQRARALFIETTVRDPVSWPEAAHEFLEAEPVRVPAPAHEPAKVSPFERGLTDPDPDPHLH
jgi:hypothetical protein